MPPLTAAGQAAYAHVLDTNNTTVSGSNSTNTLVVSGSNDKVSDGNGTNAVTVTGSNDSVSDGNGTNTVNVTGNNDTVSDGNGTNTVTVSGNNDTISDGNGANTIIASGSNETISDGNGGNLIYAADTTGTDSISDGNGTNVIVSGAGADTIAAGNGTNIIYGGAGNDTINVGNGTNVIIAGAGSDTVTAGTGSDLGIYALSDHYTISGSVLHSIAGDVDKYNGGGGTDTLRIVVTATEYAAIKPLLTAYATWLAANAREQCNLFIQFCGRDVRHGNLDRRRRPVRHGVGSRFRFRSSTPVRSTLRRAPRHPQVHSTVSACSTTRLARVRSISPIHSRLLASPPAPMDRRRRRSIPRSRWRSISTAQRRCRAPTRWPAPMER